MGNSIKLHEKFIHEIIKDFSISLRLTHIMY